MSLSVSSVYWAADRHMKTMFTFISYNYTSNELFSARIYWYFCRTRSSKYNRKLLENVIIISVK